MGQEAEGEPGHLVKNGYKCKDEFLPQNEEIDFNSEVELRIHNVKALYIYQEQDTLGDSASNAKKHKSSENSSNCVRSFEQPSHLKAYKKYHGLKIPTKCDREKHTCETCNKQFTKVSSMRRHKLSVHTGEKSFQCDQCNKIFTNLNRHKLSAHSDERPHICKLCSMSFKQADHLKRHMNVHIGEKPFKCDQCRKVFSQAFHLRRHKLACNKICHKIPVNSDPRPQHPRVSGSAGRRLDAGREYPAPPPPGVPHYAQLREREERARAEARGGLSTFSSSVLEVTPRSNVCNKADNLETQVIVNDKALIEETLEEKLLHLNM